MTLFLPFLLFAAVKFTGPTTTSQAERPIDPLYIVPPEAAKLIDTWVRQFRQDGLESSFSEVHTRLDSAPDPADFPHDLSETYSMLQVYDGLLNYSKTPEQDRMDMAKKILRNAGHARKMTLYYALTLDGYGARASNIAADFEKWRVAAAKFAETHFGDAKTGENVK